MKKSIVFTFLYALLFMCACGTDDEELMTGPGGGTGGEGGNGGGSGAGSVPQLLIGEWECEHRSAQGGTIKYVAFDEDGYYGVSLYDLETDEYYYETDGQYYVENDSNLYIKLDGESQYTAYKIVKLTRDVLVTLYVDEWGGSASPETYTRYNDEDDGGGGEAEEPGTGTEVNLSEPIIGAVEKHSIAVKGTILASEGTVFEQRGICYGTEPHPTVNDARTLAVNSDVVDATLTGLYEGTVYYIRLFAVVDGKAYYGDELSVTTKGEAVDQIDLTFIKAGTSFVEIADKYPNGFDRTNSGICYGTSPQPKITDQYISYEDQINGNWRIENLAPGTVYYIRPYRIEGARVVYFDESEIEVETIGASVDISCTVQYWGSGVVGTSYYDLHCADVIPTIHYADIPKGMYECRIFGGRVYSTQEQYDETLYIEGGSGDLEFPEIDGVYQSGITVAIRNMETGFTWELHGGFQVDYDTHAITANTGDDFGWRR